MAAPYDAAGKKILEETSSEQRKDGQSSGEQAMIAIADYDGKEMSEGGVFEGGYLSLVVGCSVTALCEPVPGHTANRAMLYRYGYRIACPAEGGGFRQGWFPVSCVVVVLKISQLCGVLSSNS